MPRAITETLTKSRRDAMQTQTAKPSDFLTSWAADTLEERAAKIKSLVAANEAWKAAFLALHGALEEIEQQLDYGQIDAALKIARDAMHGDDEAA